MNTRVERLRALLAILTTLGLVIAMMMVFAGPSARAELDEDATTCDDADFPSDNKVNAEGDGPFTISNGWGSASWDDDDDTTLDVDMNDGWTVEICVKAGNEVHVFTVTEDTVLGPFDNGISHASWRNAAQTTTTTEATTTTTEATTTTTEATTTTTEATTTTTEATTTTTEATTTTTQATTATTVEDEVLGTVVTTTTEAPTTTVADEVLGTHVLPFTGIESDHMAMLAMALLGGGLLTLVGAQSIRHRREE